MPVSVAFGPPRPDGRPGLLATANGADNSVSVFSVSADGRLSSVGPPAATGNWPNEVAFSPNGELLATANLTSNSVSMFSAGGGGVMPVGSPSPTGAGPSSVAFSHDGKLLATANSGARSISVFSVSEVGELTAVGAPFATADSPNSVAFSPRGGLLASGNGELGSEQYSMSVYSVTSAGVLTTVSSTTTPEHPGSVAFSPDGDRLATANWVPPGLGGTPSVSLYSVSAAGALTAVGAPTPTNFAPDAVAFGAGGEFLAISGFNDNQIAMYSVSAAGELAELEHPLPPVGSGPVSVAFDSSGRYLATANFFDDSVSMFSVSVAGVLTAVGAPARTGPGPCSVQFSPSGGLLATGNYGGEGAPANSATISMFTLTTDGHQTAVGSPTSVGGQPCPAVFSPDGTLLATANGDLDSTSIFSVSPDGVLTLLGSTPLGGGAGAYAHSAAFSPDGTLLAVTHRDDGGGALSTFSVAADGALTAVDSASTGAFPRAVAFRPDGQLLAITEQGGVAVFSVSAGGALNALGPPTAAGTFGPNVLAFSPSGSLLAATTGNSVLVFSMSEAGTLTPVEPATVLDDFSSAVAFSPRGDLLAATSQQHLWLFKVSESGGLTTVGSPTPFSYDPFAAIAFSPDGTLLATAHGSNSTVSMHPLAPPVLDVAITSQPPPATSATSASFEFEANYPSTLECRLDTALFAPCATPTSHELAGLVEGVHSFAVRGIDLLGNVEPSPASLSWTVDVTAPLQASLAQPVSGAAHLRAAPAFEWSPTTDNLTAVHRYELWVDGARVRSLPAGSCGATCSTTPLDALADGAHSWHVRAVDGAGNVSASDSRTFTVDAAPPSAFALTGPVDDAATTSPRPPLSWQPALDAGIGLSGYDVVLDEQTVASGLPASATSLIPPADLAEGVHRWHVVARDAYGNERASATRRFTVDTTAPVPAITAAPNPALTGRSITFDAGASTDAGSGIARVEWDLDGDGSFETDTGAGRIAVRSFGEPGTYAVFVRVSDRAGLSATARTSQRVTTVGAAGALGVSINGGARFTRSPKVTITSTWPLFATEMLVSNDGGFGMPAVLPLRKQTPWLLESSGAERSSRLVYVRFRRGLTTSETYIDDIILDESRPSVTLARVTAAQRVAAPLLTLRARDRGLSGVASVQVTNNRSQAQREVPRRTARGSGSSTSRACGA